MKKKIVIVITAVVAILLAAVVLVIVNNSFAPKTDKPEDEIIYKEPEIKELKLKSITTKDKKVKIDDTIAYFTPDNGISQVDLEINCKNAVEELFLLVEFQLKDKVETKVVYQENVKANEEFKYILQSVEDLTETKKWTVSQITEAEAATKGFIKGEE